MRPMTVTCRASGRFPPMRRSIRAAPANCWPDAGSTEPRLFRQRVLLEKSDQSCVDLSGAFLLNPVAGPIDNEFLFQVRQNPLHVGDVLAPIRPVMTESFDPAMNSDGWWICAPCHGAV